MRVNKIIFPQNSHPSYFYKLGKRIDLLSMKVILIFFFLLKWDIVYFGQIWLMWLLWPNDSNLSQPLSQDDCRLICLVFVCFDLFCCFFFSQKSNVYFLPVLSQWNAKHYLKKLDIFMILIIQLILTNVFTWMEQIRKQFITKGKHSYQIHFKGFFFNADD